MDPNCKPVHARAHTVLRSVEQQLQQSREIIRLVVIGVLQKDFSSGCNYLYPTSEIPEKKRKQHNKCCYWFQREQHSNYCWNVSHFLFQRLGTWSVQWKGYLYFIIGFTYGLSSHQNRCWCSKTVYNCISMSHGKIQIQTYTHEYQDCLDPDVFQKVVSNLVQDMEYVRLNSYPVYLLILTNSSIKDHLLKLEMVLARLSTSEFLVSEWQYPIFKSKTFAE
jgi:hypothetical protein